MQGKDEGKHSPSFSLPLSPLPSHSPFFLLLLLGKQDKKIKASLARYFQPFHCMTFSYSLKIPFLFKKTCMPLYSFLFIIVNVPSQEVMVLTWYLTQKLSVQILASRRGTLLTGNQEGNQKQFMGYGSIRVSCWIFCLSSFLSIMNILSLHNLLPPGWSV